MTYINDAQRQRDRNSDLANACPACGRDATDTDPLIPDIDGWRVHRSHTEDPNSGCYGTAQR